MTRAITTALREACERSGPKTAIVGSGITLTYAELLAQAMRFAAIAGRAGLEANEPVHVVVSNEPHDIAAFLGVWLAGGVVVPIHRSTPGEVVARFLARTRARFQADGQTDDFLSQVGTAAPPDRPLLADAVFIVFTSGSTGVPKGAVIAHEAFHGKLVQIDRLLRFGAGERTLLVLNITFSFGLWLSLLTLLRGGVLVMREKFDANALCDTVVDQRIDRVGMVPTMMRVLFSDEGRVAGIARIVGGGHLAQIIVGGESLGRSLADTIRRRFSNSELVDIYGLTETSTCDFFSFPADYAAYPGCIGRAAPGIRFRIADEANRPAVDGAVGELQIDTPYAMHGYLDDPALTSAAFSERWFRTGDLARVVDGGLVELMGRTKEVISRGGNKVTPGEIEQAICAHADVAAAMAVGVADAMLGERIHVMLVARSGAALDVGSVRQSLSSRLERFKHPDSWYVADALPTGRTGKADRSQLGAMIRDGLVLPLPWPSTT